MLLGLIALCRIDAVVFVVFYCIAAALNSAGTQRSRFISFLVMSCMSALVFAPWIAYNLYVGGHPLPVSGRALALDSGLMSISARIPSVLGALGRDLLPNVFGEIVRGGVNILLTAVILAAAVFTARKSSNPGVVTCTEVRARLFCIVMCLYGTMLLFAYAINSSATYFYPRYYIVFALPFVSTATVLIVNLFSRKWLMGGARSFVRCDARLACDRRLAWSARRHGSERKAKLLKSPTLRAGEPSLPLCPTG